ncbi:MAG: hypothetical protein HYY04_17040, partial [Chloroflexi bacterium]|nr:hypothetical protein [Chloroflexota bacterium]
MVVRARSPRHSSRLLLVLLLLVAASTAGLFSVPASTSTTVTDDPAVALSATDQPSGVRVGNLTDKSVVITWETARPTIGSVLYAPSGTGSVNVTSARTAFDLRGTGFTGETHYVRIAGLL